jgi:hypothetical protein
MKFITCCRWYSLPWPPPLVQAAAAHVKVRDPTADTDRQMIKKEHVMREGIATSATESVMPLAAAKNRGVRP